LRNLTNAITEANFIGGAFNVFRFAIAPQALDILTAVKGWHFTETYNFASHYLYETAPIQFLHINQLIDAK
jgi:hypothetical protein